MRVSDAKREATIDRLGDRYAEGYLSTDTLARRVEAAYGATTSDELDALELDLPRPWWRRRRVTIDLPAAGSTYVGRSSGCDVVIRDLSVSRVHARIDRTPRGWRITDLASTNGTWLDGRRVDDTPLEPNHRLTFGSVAARTR